MISLHEFLDRLQGGKSFRDGSCLITFDDGWRDNYMNAFPILEHHGVPATIFLTSGHIGTGKRFWQERLAEILLTEHRSAGTAAGNRLADVLERNGVSSQAWLRGSARKSVVDQIVMDRKRCPEERNESLIDELGSAIGKPPDQRPPSFISWDDARAMQRCGISFGCHGESHRLLTKLSQEEVDREIYGSKNTLESQLRVAPRAYSYPNGDYTPAIAERVRACGFEAAFSTRKGFSSLDSDRFALERVNIAGGMSSCAPLFMARTVGVL